MRATRTKAEQLELPLPLPARNWKAFALRAVLWAIIGVLAVIYPFTALVSFTLVFAAISGGDGALSLYAGVKGAINREDRWGWLIVRGIIGIAVALIFVFMPLLATFGYAAAVILTLSGWAILSGFAEIIAAIRLRREIRNEWLMGLSGLVSVIFGGALLWLFLTRTGPAIISVGFVMGVFALAMAAVLAMLAFRLKRHNDTGMRRTAEAANA